MAEQQHKSIRAPHGLLYEYWNNSTHQVENPDPIVQAARHEGLQEIAASPPEQNAAANTNKPQNRPV